MISYKEQQRLKKRRSLALKLWLFTGAVFVLLGGIIYILFFCGVYEIHNISIKGLNKISRLEIENRIDDWLKEKLLFVLQKRKSSLIISTGELQAYLLGQIKIIDSVSVIKNNRHELTVAIVEREPSGIWCSVLQNKCFYFDKNNIAYEETGRSEGFIFTTINDERQGIITLGRPVAEGIWPESILLAKQELKKNEMEAAEFSISSGSFDEFSARTIINSSSGKILWKIIFSNSTDIVHQVGALAGLVKSKLNSSDIAAISYVDLRIPERIYYKLKGGP